MKTDNDAQKSRKASRAILLMDPLLHDRDGLLIGRVGDISTDGILLYAKGVAPKFGDRIAGRLDAPALGRFEREFLNVNLRVAWTHTEVNSPWYRAGCTFIHADANEQANLSKIIVALRAS
jgi:hypothetical protein